MGKVDATKLVRGNTLADGPNRSPTRSPIETVVCFGFLTYCLLLMVEHLPTQNGGAFVLDTLDAVGDDAVIVAGILSKWGVPARLVSSPVGDDHHGQKVLEHLKACGIDVEHRVTEGLTTPLEVGIVDASGARTYFQRREPSTLASLAAPSPAQLGGAGLLYLDWYDGPNVLSAMESASSQGTPVYLNIESQYEGNSAIPGLLPYASICQVSMDEPGASGEPVEVGNSLIDKGVDTALVTLGAGGCVVVERQRAFRIRPPNANVIDGFGAGAAFSAGMIYGLRAGWSLEDCARFASAYASLKCEVKGIVALSTSEVQRAAESVDVQALS